MSQTEFRAYVLIAVVAVAILSVFSTVASQEIELADVPCLEDSVAWVDASLTDALLERASSHPSDVIPVMGYSENDCRVALYVLEDASYQLNIWTSGDSYSITANDMSFAEAAIAEIE